MIRNETPDFTCITKMWMGRHCRTGFGTIGGVIVSHFCQTQSAGALLLQKMDHYHVIPLEIHKQSQKGTGICVQSALIHWKAPSWSDADTQRGISTNWDWNGPQLKPRTPGGKRRHIKPEHFQKAPRENITPNKNYSKKGLGWIL